MLRNKILQSAQSSFGDQFSTVANQNFDREKSHLEVDGTGEIRVRNTGGSSASEGGMGNDNTDDKEKGELAKPGQKKGESMRGDETESETSFDPIKKNVREHEKSANND